MVLTLQPESGDSNWARRGDGWRTKAGLALMATLASTIVALALSEAWIRLTQPYVTPDTEREASLEYEATGLSRHGFLKLPSGQVARSNGRVLARINEYGYRGRSFSVAKPKGIVRVVVLGGSSAFDVNAVDGHDWPHLVEEKLHAQGRTRVEVINAGVPGHATWDALGRLYGEIWMFEPDYVIVYSAWNDIKYFSWLDPTHSLLRGYRPPATISAQDPRVANPLIYYSGPLDRLLCHSQLYVRVRRRVLWWQLGMMGPEGLIKGPAGAPPKHEARLDTYGQWGARQYGLDLRLLAQAARSIGATPIFVTEARLVSQTNSDADREKIQYDYVNLSHDALVRAFADCDRELVEAARLEDVSVLDAAAMLSGRSELFADHVHTTPLGSEALAEAVSTFLARRIDRDDAVPSGREENGP